MNIKNYCKFIEYIPRLSEESCEQIIKWFYLNQYKFISFYNEDGFTISGSKKNKIGFASYKLISSKDDLEFGKSILANNGINLNYENIRISIQRVMITLPPHTDPGRTVSLIYNILGEATTNFYKMENFIPNIDYKDKPIQLDATYNMQLHKWHLFNNSSIHGVKIVPTQLRLALVIDLTDKFEDFHHAEENLKSIFI